MVINCWHTVNIFFKIWHYVSVLVFVTSCSFWPNCLCMMSVFVKPACFLFDGEADLVEWPMYVCVFRPSSKMSCFNKFEMVAMAPVLCSLFVLIKSLFVLSVRKSLVLCWPMYDLTHNVMASCSSRVSEWTSTLASFCPRFVPFVSLSS